MDAATHRDLSQRARQYGMRFSNDSAVVEQNGKMLNHMLSLA